MDPAGSAAGVVAAGRLLSGFRTASVLPAFRATSLAALGGSALAAAFSTAVVAASASAAFTSRILGRVALARCGGHSGKLVLELSREGE